MKKAVMALSLMLCALTTASAQDDWANFGRYEADNKVIAAQPNDGRRVIFMGNSITDNWMYTRGSFFSSHGYISRGISGQTTYQMVLRFRDDVVNLKPKVVVINAGTNDIAQNNHRYVEDRTFGNIVTMCEMAKASGIKVILATITPCGEYRWRTEIKNVPGKIKSLNARLKEYAKKRKFGWIDYYTPLADEKDAFRADLTIDGCHPNDKGYEIMEPLAVEAISKYVKKK